MLKATQILVRPIVLGACTAALWGCGQRGPLYLPAEPIAAQRATLPQTLSPVAPVANDAAATAGRSAAPATAQPTRKP